MGLIRLLQPINGAGDMMHMAGEILREPSTHPLVACKAAVMMDEDAAVFKCVDECGRMFHTAELLTEHQRREGCEEPALVSEPEPAPATEKPKRGPGRPPKSASAN